MSDDAFDAFDDVDLDDRFLAQVDTLEQTALTQQQHSQSQSQSQLQPAAKKARSNAYQSNNNNNNNNTPATHVHLDDSDRPAAVAQRCAQAGDADSADLAGQWEAALAALEAENARVRSLLYSQAVCSCPNKQICSSVWDFETAAREAGRL